MKASAARSSVTLSVSPGIIGGAACSIDTLLNTVLQTPGVSLGQRMPWVNGIRCDGTGW